MHWKKVTLVGVGLLGGSLGMILRKRRLADRVTGYVRRPASVGECRRAGAVDEATLDLGEAITDADLVVFCTPLGQMQELARQAAPYLKKGAIVTDVGSVKASVTRQLERAIAKAGAYFVGSHPMAGAEQTGVTAARQDLFEEAVCIVTPTAASDHSALRKVLGLWRSTGAKPIVMSSDKHDLLVSRTSHLPHLLAAQLVNFVLSESAPAEQAALCANGFKDTTRVASGSPEMWRDIALSNRKYLSRAVSGYITRLEELKRALVRGDARGLAAFFEKAKTNRDKWLRRHGGERAQS